VAGCCFFPAKEGSSKTIISYLNSTVAKKFLEFLSPTLNFEIEQIKKLPYIEVNASFIGQLDIIYSIAKDDWDAEETSWEFSFHPMTSKLDRDGCICSWEAWRTQREESFLLIKQLEEKNNHIWIEVFGLNNELSPEVPEDQITLTRADREKDCQRLISYAIGCMMGRYSLDEPGLIYAHAGNVGFEPARYATFPADADGIVPLTDEPWFPDDAAQRIREFLIKVWGAETLEENLAWLAESLGKKASETPEETLRRYLADTFFKNHLQTYKKRPIYWLFSSGKQGAFQALVYLHRYHEGTLARMRGEYVVPLQGKLAARTAHLQDEIAAAPSTAARGKLQKQLDALKKKHTELIAYDDLLRHYADQRIPLDLDDGVKVNYGKFGNLLAEVKAVTGGSGDD
jgi:hypothetical protein